MLWSFQNSLIFKNQRHGQQQFKTIFKCSPDKLVRCAFVTAYRCYKHRSVKNRPHMEMISRAISHFNGSASHIQALRLKNGAADHHGKSAEV